MTDRGIIEEVLRLVNEGVSVKLPVGGSSMLPFIIGGRDSVILRKAEHIAVGDVVLAWVEGRRYVLHRVIRIDVRDITLMGDGNIAGTEFCSLDDIKAIATHVVKGNGKQYCLHDRQRKLFAGIWRKLRPVRRYLLAIYRRI